MCLSVHQNYVGTDAEKNPFFLSVVLSDQNNQRVPQYRAILWRKSVSIPSKEGKMHSELHMHKESYNIILQIQDHVNTFDLNFDFKVTKSITPQKLLSLVHQ